MKVLAGGLSPRSRLRRARRGGFASRPGFRLEAWRLPGALRFRVPGRCAADGIFSAWRPSCLGFPPFGRDQRPAAVSRSGRRNFGTISSTLTMDVGAWPARSRTGFCLAIISSSNFFKYIARNKLGGGVACTSPSRVEDNGKKEEAKITTEVAGTRPSGGVEQLLPGPILIKARRLI